MRNESFPALTAPVWDPVIATVRGLAGNPNPASLHALSRLLQPLLEEAVLQAAYRTPGIGYRWSERTDEEFLDIAQNAMSLVWEAWRDEALDQDFAARQEAYRKAYAYLAVVLFVWIENIRWRMLKQALEEA
jgi:hypothetical protein